MVEVSDLAPGMSVNAELQYIQRNIYMVPALLLLSIAWLWT